MSGSGQGAPGILESPCLNRDNFTVTPVELFWQNWRIALEHAPRQARQEWYEGGEPLV
jgi:hypothetical protein